MANGFEGGEMLDWDSYWTGYLLDCNRPRLQSTGPTHFL